MRLLSKIFHSIRTVRTALLVVLIASFAFATVIQPMTASANVAPESATSKDTDILNGDKNNGCEALFIGWLFCTGSILMSKLSDGMFYILQFFLHVTPISRGTEGGEKLYDIWNAFRSFANIIFIIIFLIVIYSQMTGFGISNYHLKKILPRLVVNIILINTSYYIGLFIVDISNIVGASLKEVLDSIAAMTHFNPRISGFGNVVTLILAGAGAGVLIYFFGLSLLPLLVSAIVMLLTIIIILIARQAIIIALIIISPLAFALNTLPNTQKWFSKWWNALFTTAMIYPIVALVIGGGSVAANIIRSGAGNDASLATLVIAILGIATEIVPLVMVPRLIKSSSGALAGAASAASKISNGVFSPVKERTSLFAERKQLERQVNSFDSNNLMGAITRAQSRMKKSKRDAEKDLQHGTELTGPTARDRFENKYAKEIAEAGASDIVESAERQQREDEISKILEARTLRLAIGSIEAGVAYIKEQNMTLQQIKELTNNPNTDSHLLAAAYQELGKTGDTDIINDAFQKVRDIEGDSSLVIEALINGINASNASKNSTHFSPMVLGAVRANPQIIQGGARASSQMIKFAAENNLYTPTSLAKEYSQNIQQLGSMAAAGELSQGAINNLRGSKASIEASQSLKGSMGRASERALGQATF